MASPSSFRPLNYTYDVFSSFHGPDVRKTLLSHIREQFNRNGITMFDDQKIVRSTTIEDLHRDSLTEAIRESRISIVILSKQYASSSWCLDELVEILECKKAMGQIVMTIFYGVDPSDVRKQIGEFGIAFDETCASKTDEERQKWSKALNEVGNIAGEDFLRWDNEANMIKKIAGDVSDKLNGTPSRDFDGMVGLDAHLRKIECLLDLDNDGVKMVGITGPAGIGKTTIARALHSRLSNKFQLTCFVDNLRGSDLVGLDEYGLKLRLQEHLLSKILNQDGTRICHLGAIKERLCDMKVLIILDDVKHINQLMALANETTWFGPGSRIVVTTENRELLQQHGIDNTYNVGFPSLGRDNEANMIKKIARDVSDKLNATPSRDLLHWEAYPSKSLPPTFHPEYLVELDMQESQLEYLWQGTQPLKNLKSMDLYGSENLKELPDLSNATNLEILELRNCKSLVEIPDLSNATNLEKLDRDNEANMIKKIARDVSDKLNATPSRDFDGMVGLDAHLREIECLLDLDNDGVKMVAITGPAGIGKTTIARALLCQLSDRFQLTCFVENLRGSYHSDLDVLRLQEQFLSKVLKQDGISICHSGVIEERLCKQRVLVILDDVKHIKQLMALANETTWFGPGSRILITTENKELLQQHGINTTYNVGFPSDEEALKILCKYAFSRTSPRHGFEGLAGRVTELCGKLPLGLCVVGSSLRGKQEDEWEDVVRRLETILHQDIEDVLTIGYESLEENEKTLFLHIAVFFNYRNGDLVKTMFADDDLDVKYGLKILENRSLIEISTFGEGIKMHRLLQQVGKKAIREQKPWKRQILIDAPDICDVLQRAKGTRALSGISFDISGINKVSISKKAFKRMPNLRFLKVYKSRDDGNYRMHIREGTKFPRRLRLLHWEAYPSKSLPPTFNPEYLVELRMLNSQLEYLWQGTQPLKNLKSMDLSGSKNLKELPDLSNATNLEKLKLRNCESLVEIPDLSNATNLEYLDLNDCKSLVEIPSLSLSEAGPGGVVASNLTNPDITKLMMRSDSSLNKTDLIDTSTRVRKSWARIRRGPSLSSPKPLDRIKHLFHGEIVVRLLNLRYVDANEKYEVLRKTFKLPGVSSVVVDDSENIIMTGTVDPITVRKALKQHRPLLVIFRPRRSDEADEEGGSEQLDEELHSMEEVYSDEADEEGGSEQLDEELHFMEEAYSGETLPKLWTGAPSASIKSGDLDSGNDMTIVPSKITTTALNNDWDSFREFLSNRLHPLTISECSAKDVIDFLRKCQTSGMEAAVALVHYFSATCEAHGIRPMDNPFRSLAVTTYLKSASEMTGEKECIFVFSCNDNRDVDETSFIEAISKELHKREVTPLMYNLLGRENLDEKILYRSSVGIMILSNSSACSRQSLDHLVKIMEHGKATHLVIIPIYFKATLSDICGLEGRFEPIYLQYMDSAQLSRIRKWKAAMAEIASIDGHEWKKEKQALLAEEVVRDACLKLYSKNSKNLIRILAFLNHSQPSDAEIVGLWGMAGIGKTSIAREIFGILAPQYDLCYFMQDFYLMCQKKGLRQMRDDFFSKVFREEKLSISACDIKPSFIKEWFHSKTILLVLDDVNDARDVEAVVGGFGWFSQGHRIILTSRRKQVLVQCKVTESYEIQKLCEFEAFRLCRQYLNEDSGVILELMRRSSGIPLALKVLGFSVSKQHINKMKEHLQSLQRNPPTQIQEAFQRSFDGLDENEKNIFLDLACFFRGEDKDSVVQLLDACGFLTYLGICDLIDESLISLLDNKIEIPIPFQDMGRFIVHKEDEDPCERSRLWDSNDIADVLTNNSGTEAIEGIFLDASDLTCELSPTVFDKMYKLRLLKFYYSTSGNQCKLTLPQGLDTLPDEISLLHWENYPLEYLPQKFNPENLVELNMPYSNMKKLWEGKRNLEKLRKIKLSHSRNLTDILTLSEAMNLEHIDLEGCTSLVDISTSVACCAKLVSLNMKDCSHLRNFSSMVDLTSLKLLNLSGCSQLEEIQDFAPNLKELYLAGTPIRELPLSIENLTDLFTLDLEDCKSLQKLPFGISNSKSIFELKLSGCTSLENLPKLEALDSRTS